MIIKEIPNSSAYSSGAGMCIKLDGSSIKEPDVVGTNDFCYCEYECDYVERVYASLTEDDNHKNFKNRFIFRRLISSDTVEIKLFKDGEDLATITDDTYGEYINGFVNGTAEQQLYVLFIIDWKKVLTLHGAGNYQVCTDLNILGSISTSDSVKFRLNHYSDRAANGLIRIESYQNGNIVSSPFDFSGLNLYNSYSLRGRFTEVSPEIQDERILNTDFELNQIQVTVIPKYNLSTSRIPRSIALSLTREDFVGNQVFITDYNIKNDDIYRSVPVYPIGIEKEDIGRNSRAAYTIEFTDRFENNRKRNN